MSDKEVVFMVLTVIYVEVSVENMIDLMTLNFNGLKV